MEGITSQAWYEGSIPFIRSIQILTGLTGICREAIFYAQKAIRILPVSYLLVSLLDTITALSDIRQGLFAWAVIFCVRMLRKQAFQDITAQRSFSSSSVSFLNGVFIQKIFLFSAY